MRINIFFIFILTTSITSGHILPEKPGEKYSISGNITDSHGESLIGANIYVSELNVGTSSNNYGFYSLTLPKGIYNITYSYIGFNTEEKQLTTQIYHSKYFFPLNSLVETSFFEVKGWHNKKLRV